MVKALLKPQLLLLYDVIHNCLEKEKNDKGILKDVNMILTTSNTNDYIEPPLIWLEKLRVNPISSVNFGKEMEMEVEVNLVCCADVLDDFAKEEMESFSLACRCMTSLLKNIGEYISNQDKLESDVYITDLSVNGIEPTGQFEIINKNTILPATRIQFTFSVEIDWTKYILDYGDKIEVLDFDDKETVENLKFNELSII